MTVYVAPHHDDALLSVPAHLLDSCNKPALVAVVFSEEDTALERTCTALHRQLNVPVECLGFAEARRRGVSMRACLRANRRAGEVDREFRSEIERIAQALSALFDRLAPAEIAVPLLPMHLDHALVERAVTHAMGLEPLYYEDQPYAALAPGMLERETARFHRAAGTEASSVPVSAIEELFESLRPFVADRDLGRILRHFQRFGERFWRRAANPVFTIPNFGHSHATEANLAGTTIGLEK